MNNWENDNTFFVCFQKLFLAIYSMFFEFFRDDDEETEDALSLSGTFKFGLFCFVSDWLWQSSSPSIDLLRDTFYC